MDGGSGHNIMYAKMLDVMGVDRTRLRPTRAPFHGIVPGKQAMPLGQIDLPVTFGDQFNYRTKTLTFEVVGSPELSMPSWDVHATRSSWPSPTIHTSN